MPPPEQVVEPVVAPVIDMMALGSHPPLIDRLESPEVNGFIFGTVIVGAAGDTVSRIQVRTTEPD